MRGLFVSKLTPTVIDVCRKPREIGQNLHCRI